MSHKLEALKKYGHHVIFISEKAARVTGIRRCRQQRDRRNEYAGDAYDVMKVSEDTSELWVVKNRHYKFTGMLTTLVGELWRFREAGRSQTESTRTCRGDELKESERNRKKDAYLRGSTISPSTICVDAKGTKWEVRVCAGDPEAI